ncbi:23S rRNA (pseudouridine(1915)-N(3))-methyltransferase RlmH [Carboxydothermus ferrireducens]|uniref:Ribosomal RNA large subunit methyltransferase H n=1 Tax=Carboxydothermus ferrireducens DSM 11255 TaxID=1119529 RepID=A0ABX2R8P3_9THEO|nr:23S rRNA (pseudouridine(1915)-N(3))-methyltransferase RlmH [Carboxydothermus ferrireducens]NYE57543.1 23S rRNA (pseudouridine1915-N3)-methyltransferase [Carboxydothermus ferrireducens DSM 11255]
MEITIVAVGKIKEKYLKEGIAEYLKRLSPYARLAIIEVDDENAPENLSPAEAEKVVKKEGERILAKITPSSFVVALDLKGKNLSSEEFAHFISEKNLYGQSKLTFIIGGSLGLSREVLERADFKLSFGRMTYPHQLMRLILLEQIYRAFKIIRGEPYHK